ncbi:MAG: HDOD domain-containing protein [Proteobacteria bacterium]|nr:HDOD domain-containing protein [Pseudomonadota bacterium]
MKHIKTMHVPSGTFVCDTSKPLILQAFLSSCVGVAAYDPEKNIGGLSHFLLPAPITRCREGDEGKYASTGLPLFLNTLTTMGASLKNLRVSIAGGAFSGAISHQDINLDIGGRTAETVRKILAKYNIRVDRAETGGFFTCRLDLDMTDWSVTISPSYTTGGTALESPLITPEKIDAVMESIKPIPQVALKILRIINEDTSHVSTLSHEVKKDQVISGQVLKYCNSAVFSGKGGIDSIDDALLIIGRDNLARIVTAITVKNLFSNHNQGYSLVKGGLYHHAIGVALIAEKLALKTGRSHPFSAYSAGLLHDIGKIVLDQFVSDVAPLFYRDYQDQSTTSLILENTYLGTDHTAIGNILAEKWLLPESVKQTIFFHHRLEQYTGKNATVDIVALANLLVHMFSAGPYLSRVDTSQFNMLLERNGFSLTDFPEIVDMIPLHALTANPEMIV